jgi:hypothetical protein
MSTLEQPHFWHCIAQLQFWTEADPGIFTHTSDVTNLLGSAPDQVVGVVQEVKVVVEKEVLLVVKVIVATMVEEKGLVGGSLEYLDHLQHNHQGCQSLPLQ